MKGWNKKMASNQTNRNRTSGSKMINGTFVGAVFLGKVLDDWFDNESYQNKLAGNVSESTDSADGQ